MKGGNTNGSSGGKESLQHFGDNSTGAADLQEGKPAKEEMHRDTQGLLTAHSDKDEAIPTMVRRHMEKSKTSRATCHLGRSPCLTTFVFPLGQRTALFGTALLSPEGISYPGWRVEPKVCWSKSFVSVGVRGRKSTIVGRQGKQFAQLKVWPCQG